MWGTQRDVSPRQLGGAHHQESKHLPAYLSWDFKKAIREDPETFWTKVQKQNDTSERKYNDAVHNMSFWVPTLSKKEYIYTRPRHANLESVSHRATCWNHFDDFDDRTNKENMQFTVSRSCSQILMTGRISTLPACKFIITHYSKLCAISVILYSGRHDRALQLVRTTTQYDLLPQDRSTLPPSTTDYSVILALQRTATYYHVLRTTTDNTYCCSLLQRSFSKNNI